MSPARVEFLLELMQPHSRILIPRAVSPTLWLDKSTNGCYLVFHKLFPHMVDSLDRAGLESVKQRE